MQTNLLSPLFTVLPETKTLIRKSDGQSFGMSWYQRTFDALITKLMTCLNKIYRGKLYSAITVAWVPDNVGRLVLSNDDDAIDHLAEQWGIQEGSEARVRKFAKMVAE